MWEDFAPPPPGVLSGLMGGKARHARAEETARDAFEQARADHALAEGTRARQLQEARAAHELRIEAIEYRLPPVDVIPAVRDFRYVKARSEIDELARPVKEIKDLYAPR